MGDWDVIERENSINKATYLEYSNLINSLDSDRSQIEDFTSNEDFAYGNLKKEDKKKFIDFCDKFADYCKKLPKDYDDKKFLEWASNNIDEDLQNVYFYASLITNKNFNKVKNIEDEEYLRKSHNIEKQCKYFTDMCDFYIDNFKYMYDEYGDIRKPSEAGEDKEKVQNALAKRDEQEQKYLDNMFNARYSKKKPDEALEILISEKDRVFNSKKHASLGYKDACYLINLTNKFIEKFPDNLDFVNEGGAIVEKLKTECKSGFEEYSKNIYGRDKIDNINLKSANLIAKKYNEKAPSQKNALGEYLNQLEGAKTHDSKEYKDLMKAVRESFQNIQMFKADDGREKIGDFASKTPEMHQAVELLKIKNKIDAYLDHKAKDGVNRNAVKKLVAVEKLNRYICKEVKKLGIDKEFTVKAGKEELHYQPEKFCETYQEERTNTCKLATEKVNELFYDKNTGALHESLRMEENKHKAIAEKIIHDTSSHKGVRNDLPKESSKNLELAENCMDRIMLRAQLLSDKFEKNAINVAKNGTCKSDNINKFMEFKDSFAQKADGELEDCFKDSPVNEAPIQSL